MIHECMLTIFSKRKKNEHCHVIYNTKRMKKAHEIYIMINVIDEQKNIFKNASNANKYKSRQSSSTD